MSSKEFIEFPLRLIDYKSFKLSNPNRDYPSIELSFNSSFYHKLI
jgi:hypothetical protein